MSLVYIGTSLKNDHPNPLGADLSFCTNDELLKAKIPHDQFANLLDQLRAIDLVEEISLISTCNRFEIYAFLKQVSSSVINEIKTTINSVSNANIDFANLNLDKAKLQFFRTYCGLNSGLIGEREISMQIDIAFRQSMAMKYLGVKGGTLLEEAISLREVFDSFVYKNKISYCSVAMEKILAETQGIENILVLGSGSTARQACTALRDFGYDTSKMTVAHRISSSSTQLSSIKEQDGLANMKFTRSKYGYHTDKVKELVFNSDLVVFAIDSKLPVINIPTGSKVKLIDFNSQPSCTFSIGSQVENYYSAATLDKEVRDYSKQRMQDPNFVEALTHAEGILKEQLAAAAPSLELAL